MALRSFLTAWSRSLNLSIFHRHVYLSSPVAGFHTSNRISVSESEDMKGEDQKGVDDKKLFQIGKMRFVDVGVFKDTLLIGIREHFEVDGNILPTKKGISLNVDQWNRLKEHMPRIDEEIKRVKERENMNDP